MLSRNGHIHTLFMQCEAEYAGMSVNNMYAIHEIAALENLVDRFEYSLSLAQAAGC